MWLVLDLFMPLPPTNKQQLKICKHIKLILSSSESWSFSFLAASSLNLKVNIKDSISLLIKSPWRRSNGRRSSAEEGGDEDAGVQVEGGVPPAVGEIQHLVEKQETGERPHTSPGGEGAESVSRTSVTSPGLMVHSSGASSSGRWG